MCPSVVRVGFRRCAEDCAASDAEVLANLMVPLLIKMSFSKDVDTALTCPIPFNDLFAKICDIDCKMLCCCSSRALFSGLG